MWQCIHQSIIFSSCISILPACTCLWCVYLVPLGVEGSDSLEQKLQMAVSRLLGARNWTHVFSRSSERWLLSNLCSLCMDIYACTYTLWAIKTRCSVGAAHPGSRRHYFQTLAVLTQKVEDHNPLRNSVNIKEILNRLLPPRCQCSPSAAYRSVGRNAGVAHQISGVSDSDNS